jgi:hypothetical protein
MVSNIKISPNPSFSKRGIQEQKVSPFEKGGFRGI